MILVVGDTTFYDQSEWPSAQASYWQPKQLWLSRYWTHWKAASVYYSISIEGIIMDRQPILVDQPDNYYDQRNEKWRRRQMSR